MRPRFSALILHVWTLSLPYIGILALFAYIAQTLDPPRYRIGGSDSNRPSNFSGLPGLSRLGAGSALGAQSNDFKVPKIESELYFNTDSDLPSFKRPKISDESQHMQIPSLARRDLLAAPLFGEQLLPVNVEHGGSCHVQNENGLRETREKTVELDHHYNPLNEPSPLGLNLRKSPSLLDLIQRKLGQCEDDGSDGDQSGRLRRLGGSASAAEKDKLKAANFPAAKLRIGTWECMSRYDGDLVAKCYYAKRKLVWEVLDNGLKSKMEVQWSEISALKAVFPDDQPAVLDIELSRPPLFYREINPQPRKHTLWHSTSDFTDGQASICRHHSIQFPAGVLNRHFEKLLQCDDRLKALNEQTHSIQDSSFYDNKNIQIDRHHMLHLQSVLSEHAALQPLTITDDVLLQPSAVHSVDCSQSHLSVQGFQNEPSQHFSPHHGGVENVRSVRMDGLRNEPLQQRDHFHHDIGLGVEHRHRQGGFQLQFAAAASPSSVIDTRGLNESSSSSETEEGLSMDIRSEPLKLHASQEGCTFSPGHSRQLSHWAPHHLHEGAMAWTRESQAVSSPINHASEKQALNELSLHLLGEPFAERGPYLNGRVNAQGVHDMLLSNGSTYLQQSNFSNSFKDFAYKQDKNVGIMQHSQLVPGELLMKVRESQWNAVLEQRAFEARSSSLSHGSLVDLVYLPRIASQPQFLEPGP
ncbi:hypothetical protein GOP47_0018080 [Adiantum capillus-veneris]|uniref:TRF2/HOY1 PH-like domain-containing protein n=1 Tax=Adiantum capillus-veneris TaxID=13818 RepID=A0A9D4ZB97_ADICA|nr:hypothetical protein GOP47_0018080 [Adiantum capillus-veneris]